MVKLIEMTLLRDVGRGRSNFKLSLIHKTILSCVQLVTTCKNRLINIKDNYLILLYTQIHII